MSNNSISGKRHDLMADIVAVEALVRKEIASIDVDDGRIGMGNISVQPVDGAAFEAARIAFSVSLGHGIDREVRAFATAPLLPHPIDTAARQRKMASGIARAVGDAFREAEAAAATRSNILRIAQELVLSSDTEVEVIAIQPEPIHHGRSDDDRMEFFVELVGSFPDRSGGRVRRLNTISAADAQDFARDFRNWLSLEACQSQEPPRFKAA